MDYSKIKLENERNSHVTKRLNRLSTWKFFKVIYRENIWRMFGYNFLMLLCLAPLFVMSILGSINLSTAERGLPMLGGFGFSTGAWIGVGDYLAEQVRTINTFTGAMMVVTSVLITLILSGGFAVIRDSFWTGKLSAVGVFKSMWKGIKANIGYALVSTLIIAGSIFGIFELYVYLNEIAQIRWLAILTAVLSSFVMLFLTTYLMILCSVTVTYKQKIGQNLRDAWRLMWLNILPNLIHLIFALIPVGLYFLFSASMLQQIFMIIMLMFGGLYFPLVWQTHMMKTFALFHPVEVKKKKKVAQEAKAAAQAKVAELPEAQQRPAKAKKKRTAAPVVADENVETPTENVEEVAEEVETTSKVVEDVTENVEDVTKNVEEPTEVVEDVAENVETPTENVEEHTEVVEEPTETVEEVEKNVETSTKNDEKK